MKFTVPVFVLLMISGSLKAQPKYEPGYFISDDGKRSECMIKNLDWESSPVSFDYRLNDVDGKGDLESVREFGITGRSVFRRFTVLIDRSSNDVSHLSHERMPSFKQETLFLRLLSDGKAVLYMYGDEGLIRFFYSMDGGEVTQLVYKRYMTTASYGETGLAAENEQYKQTLLNEFTCASISKRDVVGLSYERAPMMKFFGRYNECTGTAKVTNEVEAPSSPMHLTLLGGAGFNSLSISGAASAEMKSQLASRFGVELEIVLPFHNHLWSVPISPIYQGYSAESSDGSAKIDYQVIDLGLGLRRYLFLKETGSLYFTLGAVYAWPLASKDAITLSTFSVTPGHLTTSFDTSGSISTYFGVGIKVKELTIEVNYGFSRGVMNYVYFSSTYSGPNVMLGYRIF